MINREETIGWLLDFIAQKETIQEMRHDILMLSKRIKKQYPLLVLKETEVKRETK